MYCYTDDDGTHVCASVPLTPAERVVAFKWVRWMAQRTRAELANLSTTRKRLPIGVRRPAPSGLVRGDTEK